MKKSILLSMSITLILLLSITGLSQIFNNKTNVIQQKKEVEILKSPTKSSIQNNLTGTWYWDNGVNNAELYLIQNGNSVSGKHCCVFFNGSKLDCIDDEDTNSISLNMTAVDVYEGTLKSGFSDAVVPIRITFNPVSEEIFFQQLSQPIMEYYLPNNVTMTLAKD